MELDAEQARVHRGIRALNHDFCAALPEGAERTGEWRATAGDRFARIEISLPNGTYRVIGGDWLLTIAGRRFVGAQRATVANKYGGSKVVTVPPADPPKGGPATEEHHGEEEKARAYSGIPENGAVKVTGGDHGR